MTFITLAPCRVVDTRNLNGELGGPALSAQNDRRFDLGAACGIDEAALALSVNITAVGATAAGHLKLRAGDLAPPETWAVSYNPGQNRASQAMVALDPDGGIRVKCDQPEGTVDLVLDVNGYFRAACGDGATLPPETCDGDCGDCGPPQFCRANSGDAATCDLVCQLDLTACSGETRDDCCPFGAGCGNSEDSDCAGSRWEAHEWAQPVAGSPCTTISVYGIEAGGSYMFTTCSPAGGGTGDPSITSVADNTERSYPVDDKDCSNPLAIPHAAGWSCRTDGSGQNACSGNDTGGFIAGAGAIRFDVTICDADGDSFSSPFHIFYNANTEPSDG